MDPSPIRRLARHAWILLLPLTFVVYATSFDDMAAIEREHSVLGDADSANYIRLIEDFDLTKVYGDPYRHSNDTRTIGDNAQKHKIHHVLYVGVASVVYRILAPIYGLVGATPRAALYGINAVVTCLNVFLLFLLLRRTNPHGNNVFPFLLFYVAALSTWIFGSAPESWPFSGTLVLAFLLFYTGRRPSPVALGALIGVFMLNNFTLVFLLAIPLIGFIRDRVSWPDVLKKIFVCGLIAGVAWVGSLTLLSVFDPFFRPDEYARYTLWYEEFTDPDLSVLSAYVWKSVLSGLFVTSIVSNQSDPFVPQEALLYTVQSSRLGLVATLGWIALAFWTAVRIFTEWRESDGSWLRRLSGNDGTPLLAFCVAIVWMTVFLYYPGGFLYSTTVVPVLAVVLCRYLDLRKRSDLLLLALTLALMLVNNVAQIRTFQQTLDRIV